MAVPTNIGINLVSHTTAQSVEVSTKGEVKILTDKDGFFAQAAFQNPTMEFSVRGKRGNLSGGSARRQRPDRSQWQSHRHDG